jgi:hypothetical protein
MLILLITPDGLGAWFRTFFVKRYYGSAWMVTREEAGVWLTVESIVIA